MKIGSTIGQFRLRWWVWQISSDPNLLGMCKWYHFICVFKCFHLVSINLFLFYSYKIFYLQLLFISTSNLSAKIW